MWSVLVTLASEIASNVLIIAMPTKRNRQDIYIYILLLALGGLQFALSCRTSDFAYDPYYYELARSILAKQVMDSTAGRNRCCHPDSR